MDFSKCPLRSAITDPLELIEHDEVGCEGCFTSEVKAEPVQAVYEEETKPEAKPSPVKNVRKRKAKATDEHVPDKVKIARIRYEEGISRNQAAVRLAETRIAIGGETKADQAGGSMMVSRKEMPYGPQGLHFPPNDDGSFRASVLSMELQKRYVAIATNFLKGDGHFYRFPANRFELAGFDELLIPERTYVEEYFFKCLQEGKIRSPYACFVAGARGAFLKRMKRRLKVLTGDPFQKVVALLPWSSELGAVGVTYARPVALEVLHPGITKQLNFPDPRRKCAIPPAKQLMPKIMNLDSNCPIETDEIAFELLKNNDVDFVADASTIRQLLIRPWMNRNYKVALKCTVKRIFSEGITKKYVVFSKPFPLKDMNSMTCDRALMKWAFKTMCMQPNNEQTIAEKNDNMELDVKPAVVKLEACDKESIAMEAASDTEPGALEIDEQEPSGSAIVPKEEPMEDININNAPDADDLLGGILNEMGSTKKATSNLVEQKESPKTLKRYSIVSFDVDRNYRILIRSSNREEKEKGSACVIVKPEYAVWLGAEKCSVEEEIYTYLSGILKGSQWIVTAHVFPVTGDIVQISRKGVKDAYGSISDDIRKLISCRCEMLCGLLDQSRELDCGEYLIVQRNEALEILSQHPETDGCNSEQFSPPRMVARLYESENVTNTVPENHWNGLNPHIPLVWHIVQGRAPGALPPFRKDWRPNQQQKGKKKNRWQSKPNRNGLNVKSE